jgi:hypothetical protein
MFSMNELRGQLTDHAAATQHFAYSGMRMMMPWGKSVHTSRIGNRAPAQARLRNGCVVPFHRCITRLVTGCQVDEHLPVQGGTRGQRRTQEWNLSIGITTGTGARLSRVQACIDQYAYSGPASKTRMDKLGFSDSRFATTLPATPPAL